MTYPGLDGSGIGQPVEWSDAAGRHLGPLPHRVIETEFLHEQEARGVPMRHREAHDMYRQFTFNILTGDAIGNIKVNFNNLGFYAKTVIVWNPSTFFLLVNGEAEAPIKCASMVMALYPAVQSLSVVLSGGVAPASNVTARVLACESVLQPTPWGYP